MMPVMVRVYMMDGTYKTLRSTHIPLPGSFSKMSLTIGVKVKMFTPYEYDNADNKLFNPRRIMDVIAVCGASRHFLRNRENVSNVQIHVRSTSLFDMELRDHIGWSLLYGSCS